MDESTKSKKLWGELERTVLTGKGIDIGCGVDPVTPDVRRFDVSDGDANEASRFVNDQFDFVYASHCLEHMHEPRKTVLDWWSLVRPGGHLFFMVPDEDLYEQGIFPSRFNPDHKATFTISKERSWSPVSINVLDLIRSLPGATIIKLVLQDEGYDRQILRHGKRPSPRWAQFLARGYYALQRRKGLDAPFIPRFLAKFSAIDQTRSSRVVAQIACIVRKTS